MYFIKTPQLFKAIWPNIIWDCPEDRPEFQFTFDDGPCEHTPYLLDALAKSDRKATFFCLGRQIENHPDIFERIKEEGHTIGNHGYAHLDGWKVNTESYLSDVERGFELCGSKLFRPPFGRLRWSQYRELKDRYTIVMWSSMPGDFDDQVSEELLKSRLEKTTTKDIIVLHDHVGRNERLELLFDR